MSSKLPIKTSLVAGGSLGARPVLPGSTPAPGGAGRTNPYSHGGTSKKKLFSKTGPAKLTERLEDGLTASGMPDLSLVPEPDVPKDKERRMQNGMLTKLVDRLPHNVRQPVTSILTMAFEASSQAQTQIDHQNIELITVRGELKKKTTQMDQLNRSCDIYRERLKVMEEKLRSLKDDIDSRQKITTQNKRHMARMSSTNRMLINSLEALNEDVGIDDDPDAAGSPSSNPNGKQNTPHALTGGSLASGGLSPEMSAVLTAVAGEKAARPLGQNAANEKLRESLLRVAREHYRYVKKSESLEKNVRELRSSLQKAEMAGRQYKLELDEFREPSVHDAKDEIQAMVNYKKEVAESVAIHKDPENRNKNQDIDERFKFQLIHRNAMDPLDACIAMRRLLTYVSSVPQGVSEKEMGAYFAHDAVCKIFECEAVMLCIAIDQGDGVTKHFSREGSPHIHVDVGSTVTTEVMRTNSVIRINNMERRPYQYNTEVDGCPTVQTRKLLAVPVVDHNRDEIIGTFVLINKTNDSFFTDLDEIYAEIFAEQVATFFTSSLWQNRLLTRLELMSHLFHAPDELVRAIPEAGTVGAKREMDVKAILMMMESVAATALKCSKARAFVRNDRAFRSGEMSGNASDLIMIDTAMSNSVDGSYAAIETRQVSHKSGIAGLVNTQKRSHLLTDTFIDMHFNTEVDVDPVGSIMVCVPILDYGTSDVMGVLQLVATSASPTMSKQAGNDGQVLFDEAAEWLAYVMAQPLSFLLKGIGSKIQATPKAPKRMASMIRHSIVDTMVSAENLQGDDEPEQNNSPKGMPTSATGLQSITPTRRRMSVAGRSTIKALTAVNAAEQENESLKLQLIAANKQLSELMRSPGVGAGGHFTEELEEELEEKNEELQEKEEQVLELQSQLAKLDKQLSDAREEADLSRREALQQDDQVASKAAAEAVALREQAQAAQQAAEVAEKKAAALAQELATSQEMLQRQREAMASGDGAADAMRHALEDDKQRLAAEKAAAEARAAEVEAARAALEAKAKAEAEQAASFKAQLDNISATLRETQEARARADGEAVALRAQVTSSQETMAKKDGVIAVMQEQLVKLASEQVSKIDQSVMEASEAARAADLKALEDAQAAAEAAAAADAAAVAAAAAAAVPPTPSPEEILAAWVEYMDDSGTPYYYNTITQVTSWERPPGMPGPPASPVHEIVQDLSQEPLDAGASSGSALVRVGNFVQYFDDDGHAFWVNEVTGESQWEAPPGAPGTEGAMGASASAGGHTIEL